MEHKDFLVEIGTEELPPKALRSLAKAFNDNVVDGLRTSGLIESAVKNDWFCSPRRLAVRIDALPIGTPDQQQERLGPAVQAAFDKDGKPSKAAEGFAASVGTTVDKLERKMTDKGERLAFTVNVPGKQTIELLPGIVADALKKLPIPKRMRWGNSDVEFVRPVHWVVMLFGNDVIDCEILGIKAGRETHGHRFLHSKPITLASPASYVSSLEKVNVRVNDSDKSLSTYIKDLVQNNLGADEVSEPFLGGDALYHEVASLCEWPVAIIGEIPEKFHDLPGEVLVLTLEVNQRYFTVFDGASNKFRKFITFANIESKNPDVIRIGNERVVTPRLEDAVFFYEQDRTQRLDARIAQLDSVTFQNDLGSYGAKVKRVRKLAALIAAALGGDKTDAERAADLAKCDLVTSMVFEFPELQGVMGRYYAQHDGEKAEVANAIFEQYLPRYSGDDLPKTKTGQALAIADKLDTICGIFAIGQKPSGNKDPFGLRRQALGVLRIVIEKNLDLDLALLTQEAMGLLYPGKLAMQDRLEISEFFLERLRAYLQEQGIRADVFNAVAANHPPRPLDFVARAKAVNVFMQSDAAVALAAANKRISNILRKSEMDIGGKADTALFETEDEKRLNDAIRSIEAKITPLVEKGKYEEALARLSALREPVDSFFDNVMVMADDIAVRRNRLALLNSLRELFNYTADFAQIQVD